MNPFPDQSVRSARQSFLRLLSVAAVLLSAASNSYADFQGSTHMTAFDEETIGYNKAKADDPITRLQQLIDSGEIKLRYETEHGYLRSVLDALGIPESSQVLVFSKTSLQRERISPKTPRALFFNDDVYIGFIPGAPLLEVSTADPKLGAVFYTLNQNSEAKPKFTRTDQCLECHASAKSMGVPGHLLRSFVTDESGVVDLASGTSQVNHRTPIEERWGGWYVTGKHGEQLHRGNLIGKEAFDKQEKTPNHLGNVTDLSPFFDVTRYPEASSDIVSLMVLEHQTHMHNFITRLHYESTVQIARYGHINYVTNIANAFLKYMLFTEEVPIIDQLEGSAKFVTDFQVVGPKDSKGRSLRELHLKRRLFKYPCSYLIYSKTFDALPEPIQEHLYQRLWDILTGKDTSPEFQHVPADIKQSILEILVETKEGLPNYWKIEKRADAK
jgi:hypothetical protein